MSFLEIYFRLTDTIVIVVDICYEMLNNYRYRGFRIVNQFTSICNELVSNVILLGFE